MVCRKREEKKGKEKREGVSEGNGMRKVGSDEKQGNGLIF